MVQRAEAQDIHASYARWQQKALAGRSIGRLDPPRHNTIILSLAGHILIVGVVVVVVVVDCLTN
jgi:hypothetical protein